MKSHGTVAALTAAGVVLAACGGDGFSGGTRCRTSVDMLANIQDGMTYQQVVRVIGCEGLIDQNQSKTVSGNQITVAKWDGPGRSTFSATLVTFRNDRVVSFAVNGQ